MYNKYLIALRLVRITQATKRQHNATDRNVAVQVMFDIYSFSVHIFCFAVRPCDARI